MINMLSLYEYLMFYDLDERLGEGFALMRDDENEYLDFDIIDQFIYDNEEGFI